MSKSSDGGPTDYYDLPEGSETLNDLIEYKNMSFALGNIFKACYRFGEKDAASRLYDLNKIIYFANRLKRLEERRSYESTRAKAEELYANDAGGPLSAADETVQRHYMKAASS